MFLHKLCRTFVAMFWGWVAFVVLLPLIMGIAYWRSDEVLADILGNWLAFSIYSPPFILVAWLFVAFPVDCLVPESSRLRTPKTAARLGGVCGMLPFILLGTYDQMTDPASWLADVGRAAAHPGGCILLGGAAIVGAVAAWHVVARGARLQPNHKS